MSEMDWQEDQHLLLPAPEEIAEFDRQALEVAQSALHRATRQLEGSTSVGNLTLEEQEKLLSICDTACRMIHRVMRARGRTIDTSD